MSSRPDSLFCWYNLCKWHSLSLSWQRVPLFFVLFLWLIMWRCHTCFSLLNDISFVMMDLYLSSLDTIVPEVSCYVVYEISSPVDWRFQTDDITFAGTLIWYHSHRPVHTNIYWDHLLCAYKQLFALHCWMNPAGNYMFKVNNRNTRTRCEICSKLTIKTPERRQWRRSGVFIVNFEHISHLVLVFLLLTLNR